MDLAKLKNLAFVTRQGCACLSIPASETFPVPGSPRPGVNLDGILDPC